LAASRERNLINAKAGTPVPAFFARPPAQAGPMPGAPPHQGGWPKHPTSSSLQNRKNNQVRLRHFWYEL